MKVLMVTGYKPREINIFKENDPKISIIKAALEKRIIGFIEEGLEWILISGQMGVELWAAEVAMDLKEHHDIQIAVIPPFENQDERWPEDLKFKYEELTMVADFYQPLYNGEYKGPYQFRAKNKFLVEKSDGCLILLDDEYPGSNKFFYEEAKRATKNYQIYLITPSDLDEMVEEMRMADPDYWN